MKATGSNLIFEFSEDKPTGHRLVNFKMGSDRKFDQKEARKILIDKYSRKMGWK